MLSVFDKAHGLEAFRGTIAETEMRKRIIVEFLLNRD